MDLALLVKYNYGVPDKGLTRLDYLCMVHETSIEDMIDKVTEMFKGCKYRDFSGLSNLTVLKTLWIANYYQLGEYNLQFGSNVRIVRVRHKICAQIFYSNYKSRA